MDINRQSSILSPKMRRLIVFLFASSFVYFLLTAFVFTTLEMRDTMVWNIFLAGLPLVFVLISMAFWGKKKILSWLFLIPWLAFFPNGPYMLTDYIHLDMYRFYERNVGFLPIVRSWTGFVHIVWGVLLGTLLGYLSLYILQKKLVEMKGKALSWVFVLVVSLLSGIAIYLGRIIRLNSWNLITHPRLVLDILTQVLDKDFLALCLVFAVMIIVTYIPFCFMLEPDRGEEKR